MLGLIMMHNDRRKHAQLKLPVLKLWHNTARDGHEGAYLST